MSNKTRKHIWSGALVLSLAIVGVLAAFIVLAGNPASTAAHSGGAAGSHCTGESEAFQNAHDALAPAAHPKCADDMEPSPTTPSNGTGMTGSDGDMIASSSTSASSTVKLELTIESLPMRAVAGSSVELYLEDDFQVPDSIDRDTVYFTVESTHANQGGGGRVYTADPVEIDDDDHFGGDDDWSIRVFIPDMNDAENSGYNGPMQGQQVNLVFTKAAGIKNPSEAGTHSVGYSVLGPRDDANDGPQVTLMVDRDKDGEMDDPALETKAKISLSDEDNSRGYEMTVTGSGFNNGVSAGAYVLSGKDARFQAAKYWETLDCEGMKKAAGVSADMNQYCFHYVVDEAKMTYQLGMGMAAFEALSDDDKMAISEKVLKKLLDDELGGSLPKLIVTMGTEVGSGTVGSDDKVSITFEVTAPTFKPGAFNFVAIADGEGRISSDSDAFELEPSIRVSPTQVSSGDTVTVFAQDFPVKDAAFAGLKLAGQSYSYYQASNAELESPQTTGISSDGSATATFEMPGGLKGTVRVDATWGDDDENAKITVAPSTVSASQTDVLPNDSITLTGNGFASNACIPAGDITLDDVPMTLDDESDDNCDDGKPGVQTSNAGQFVATIHLSPAVSGSDPTLIAGTHSLDVEDSKGFTGSVTLDIAAPVIKVTPDVAGPRDYISISGENWPVDNPENPLSDAVEVMVHDTGTPRKYSAFADTAGRFTVDHQVHRGVAIPSTIRVEVKYDDIVKIVTFDVPVATITVDPGEAQPGDMISISATNMPVYTDADEVKIGGSVIGSLDGHTDRDGNITVDDILVPGLDPGTYSVQLKVKGTVAIGELKVLAESAAGGAPAELPGAMENLGDNLVAIFHFDDVGKTWSFYDPRPEFAELNTLTAMANGEAYWILVSESVDEVVLNNKVRSLTCRGDDCWNLEVW